MIGSGSYAKIRKEGDEVIKIFHPLPPTLGIGYLLEYEITCRLFHPHLLHAKRITPEGYLVFDYYSYTLKDLTSLPYEKKLNLVLQFLSGLSALHSYGYLHLDLKPNNLLVSEKMHLVIADFGSAMLKERFSSRERIAPKYRAPEQKDYYSYASDIWSAGIIIKDFLGDLPSGWKLLEDEKELPIQNLRNYEVYSFPLPQRFFPYLHKFALICGDEKAEAFLLAVYLYYRCRRYFNTEELFTTCLWMGIKIVEGAAIDIREIGEENYNYFSQLELKIIHTLKGKLYPFHFKAKGTIRLLAYNYLIIHI